MKHCVSLCETQFSKSAFSFSKTWFNKTCLVSVDEAYVSPDFMIAIQLFHLMKVRSVDL